MQRLWQVDLWGVPRALRALYCRIKMNLQYWVASWSVAVEPKLGTLRHRHTDTSAAELGKGAVSLAPASVHEHVTVPPRLWNEQPPGQTMREWQHWEKGKWQMVAAIDRIRLVRDGKRIEGCSLYLVIRRLEEIGEVWLAWGSRWRT